MIGNSGTLIQHKTCWKSYQNLEFLAPNRNESDLLNESLYILVDQEAHSAQFDPISYKILSNWDEIKRFFKSIFSAP